MAEAKQPRMANGSDDPSSRVYVLKTLRSAAVVTAFVLFMLTAYGQWWAILPVLTGMALAITLLVGMDWFIRRLFAPERVRREDGGKAIKGGAALVAFGAIKYPLVALLIWALVHLWDTRRIIAFVGGFMLLHLVMVSRALGRLLIVDKIDTV